LAAGAHTPAIVAHTLNGANGQAVAYDMTHACDVIRECGDTVPTLQARMGTGGNQIPLVMAHGQANAEVLDGVCPTLNCNHEQPMVFGADLSQKAEGIGFTPELSACVAPGTHPGHGNHVVSQYAVRRLTPLECERLQGFPDGWTDIPGASDSARYKALGNSVAIPCVMYCLEGIAIELDYSYAA
jgi:DNA (cytosine-5)-methyltransferase 1